jgi:RHS repeat-associated protein
VATVDRRERRPTGLTAVSHKEYCYDALGRTTQLVHVIDGVLYRTSYTYDELGAVVTTTLPSGRVLRENRDATGAIVTSTIDGAPIVNLTASDAAGHLTKAALANGITERICYDVLGRPRRITAGNLAVSLTCGATAGADALTGTPLWEARYLRGLDGRISDRTIAYRDPTTGVVASSTASYTYDGVGRLASETAGAVTTGFGYDVVDNLLNAGTVAYTPGDVARSVRGAGPHALQSATGYALTYDGDGNATRLVTPLHAYDLTWSPNGRVTKVVRDAASTYEMSYDERGTRVEERSSTGATTRYSGAVKTTPTETITQLDLGAIEVVGGSRTELYWGLGDQVGSLAALVDRTGALVQVGENTPFGHARTARTFDPIPGDGFTPHHSTELLTGKDRDAAFAPEDEVYDFGARIYAAPLGRWLSVDPLFDDGLNRYAYVKNDPVNLADPDGRSGELTPVDQDKRLSDGTTVIIPAGTYKPCVVPALQKAQAVIRKKWADKLSLLKRTITVVTPDETSISTAVPISPDIEIAGDGEIPEVGKLGGSIKLPGAVITMSAKDNPQAALDQLEKDGDNVMDSDAQTAAWDEASRCTAEKYRAPRPTPTIEIIRGSKKTAEPWPGR